MAYTAGNFLGHVGAAILIAIGMWIMYEVAKMFSLATPENANSDTENTRGWYETMFHASEHEADKAEQTSSVAQANLAACGMLALDDIDVAELPHIHVDAKGDITLEQLPEREDDANDGFSPIHAGENAGGNSLALSMEEAVRKGVEERAGLMTTTNDNDNPDDTGADVDTATVPATAAPVVDADSVGITFDEPGAAAEGGD